MQFTGFSVSAYRASPRSLCSNNGWPALPAVGHDFVVAKSLRRQDSIRN
jgi:hypothetical protein